MRDNMTYKMITYIKEKETLHTQTEFYGETHKSHSPSPPREADERERVQKQSFERETKITVSFTWNKPSIFFILFTFSPFHEISRDITGNSNSTNKHSQLVH